MTFGGLEKFTLIDYPGLPAAMVYTIGCNFRCPYCHNPELVDETVETRIPEEEVLAFLANRKRVLEGFVVTGGEPTMHDELPNFLRKVKALGYRVKLDTNGTNPAMVRALMKAKLVDYYAMDIKSPLSAYAAAVQRPVDTDAIQESIELLKGAPKGVSYEFRTTVVKGMLSPEDLEQIGREIRGAKRYYLQKFVPNKLLNPQFLRKTTYSDEEFEDLRQKLSTYVEECAIR
ncbi:MAG: anaerobic ribonucleoside-triphosphate reductase activating protein [Patescibacteria group bacterium]|nr:anaerobic ribonucleoside-triphosphate reductase activating protein [Patescibacteria group bacterium]